MKKYSIHILLGFSIILIIYLGFNICKYISYKHNNDLTINNINKIETDLKNNIQILEKLKTELNSIKEEKKEKIWKYEQWNQWNKEILEKIN